jgi:tol-pal system protein YbgF
MSLGRVHWLTGGAVAAALGFASFATPAIAQTNDLQTRIQRLERDVRDLQAATFRRPPGPVADSPADVEPPQPAIPDLNPLMRRVDGLEQSVTRLTGQMEELGHQLDQVSQKLDRLQKEVDLQASAQAQASTNPTGVPPEGSPGDALALAAPGDTGPTLRPYAPAPASGTLGQIPAGTTLPTPGGRPAPLPPDANDAAMQKEYDSAQALLARAQYNDAAQAFRAFADAHPDSDLTPHALYRTGDIAYSVQKDYDTAAHDFAELLKKYPMAMDAPDSMLKLGLSLVALGQTKEGCAALVALPAKYPDASPVIVARARNERRNNKCR